MFALRKTGPSSTRGYCTGQLQHLKSNVREIDLLPILSSYSESFLKSTACIIATFELPDVDIIFQIILPHIVTFKIVIVEEKNVILCSRRKSK